MFIKFVEHKTHAIHETIHISGLALRIPGAIVRSQGSLECFEVLHPLQGKVMGLDIGFIEDKNKGQFSLVKDATSENQSMQKGAVSL
jgi:hypothetical protein